MLNYNSFVANDMVNGDLPSLNAHQVDLSNRLSRLSLDLEATFHDHDITLSFLRNRRSSLGDEQIKITFGFDDQIVAVFLPKDGLQRICASIGYDISPDIRVSKTLSIITEFVFTPCIEVLETMLGTKIEVQSVETAQFDVPETQSINFRVTQEDLPEMEFKLVARPDFLNYLLDVLPTTPLPSRSLRESEVVASFRTDFFNIALVDLRQCIPGDVILTEVNQSDLSDGHLWVGANLMASISTKSGEIALASEFESYTQVTDHRKYKFMEREDKKSPLDDLEVLLSIEVDRIDIKIADVENLNPGSVVKLNSEHPDQVVVYANNQPFAEGDLVQLEDSIGVQITKVL